MNERETSSTDKHFEEEMKRKQRICGYNALNFIYHPGGDDDDGLIHDDDGDEA